MNGRGKTTFLEAVLLALYGSNSFAYSESKYKTLMIEWCIEKGIDPTEDNLAKYFKLHLERGISYLTGTNFIKSLDDLLNLATEE